MKNQTIIPKLKPKTVFVFKKINRSEGGKTTGATTATVTTVPTVSKTCFF